MLQAKEDRAMRIGIKPTVDVVFKTIFGNEEHCDITASFLNAILQRAGRQAARRVSILNPVRLGQFRGDKDAVLDIRAEDEAGREFQLEVQVRAYTALPRRMLHNWASCYLSRLRKGDHYEELRPVVSIWILEGKLFRDGRWFHEFSLQECGTGMRLCDDETIFIIELPQWAAEHEVDSGVVLENELDRWLYFLLKGEELDVGHPSEILDDLWIREALSIMAAFTKSEAARDLYRRRMEYRMEQASIRAEDRETGLAEGRVEGRAEGRAQGLAEGLTEGRTEGDSNARRDIAVKLRREGLATDLIAKATGLSTEEIESL
jgi:predicted transposase/invertase (TIGR01784 family)